MTPSRILRAAVIAAALALPAIADEGRIPIYEPTTITQSGAYVLTNNITATSGPAIHIDAADVAIDLNGHTIHGDVDLRPQNTASAHQNVSLRRGRIEGSLTRSLAGAAAMRSPVGLAKLSLVDVVGLGGGLVVDPCSGIEIRNTRIGGTVFINGNGSAIAAHVIDSTFGGPVTFGGLAQSVVRGNSFAQNLELYNGDGWPVTGTIVEANTVAGAFRISDQTGTELHNVIRGNVFQSLEVQGGSNQLSGNTVRGGSVLINSSHNVIDGNRVVNAPYGLILNGNDNVYRNNILHGNASGAVQDNGTANVDAGGNVN